MIISLLYLLCTLNSIIAPECSHNIIISVVSGSGHPEYLGHLGRILSGSSGSHPLYWISGSDPDEITCD